MSAQAEQIVKSFAGTRVLDEVDLLARDGEVHALLGANGSGKSTLVKILSGVYQTDGGLIRVGHRACSTIATPFEANELGIAVVHQEAPLIDTMTVAECIALLRGYPTTATGRVRWRSVQDQAAVLLERYQIPVSPRTLAGKLAPAERALVALVIALDRVDAGLQLLILDEVTASLPEDEAKIYLARVDQIARSGTAVLMVTHRLAELHGLARAVTVLRDGKRIYAGPAGELDDATLVSHMVGSRGGGTRAASRSRGGEVRKLWQDSSQLGTDSARDPSPEPAVEVRHLAGDDLTDLTFRVKRGEIVGVAGLVDSGIAELPKILAGIKARRSGEIRVGGQVLDPGAGPAEAIATGIALLPADRLRNGGIPTLSVADNALLPILGRFWHRRKRETAVLDRIIADFDVRPPRKDAQFGKLSGGNQQKVILAKWLLTRPTLLVLDDPTSGVDPGAREIIFERLRDAAREGVGVLLFSTEPEQLAFLCTRILVIRTGKIAAELTGAELTREAVSHWCYA